MIAQSWKSVSYAAVRTALALSFLAAGVVKIQNPLTFAATIDAFGILPGPLVLPMAVVLPVVEIIGAVALIFDIRGSLGLITFMILTFIAVLAWGLRMGLDIDCGCYGPGDPEAVAFAGIRGALRRDLLMLACAAALYIWRGFLGVRPVALAEKYQSLTTLIRKAENT